MNCFFFKKSEKTFDIPICPICLESLYDLNLLNKKILILNCGHVFCKNCLSELNFKYYSITCPICRTNKYATVFKVNNLKCTKCQGRLINLQADNIMLTHLTCGHAYCLDCACKLKTNESFSLVKCLIYKDNNILKQLKN